MLDTTRKVFFAFGKVQVLCKDGMKTEHDASCYVAVLRGD